MTATRQVTIVTTDNRVFHVIIRLSQYEHPDYDEWCAGHGGIVSVARVWDKHNIPNHYLERPKRAVNGIPASVDALVFPYSKMAYLIVE